MNALAAALGSGDPRIADITATPWTPRDLSSRTCSSLIPPIAYTGTRTERTMDASPSGPITLALLFVGLGNTLPAPM